jgi:hypothetical protein
MFHHLQDFLNAGCIDLFRMAVINRIIIYRHMQIVKRNQNKLQIAFIAFCFLSFSLTGIQQISGQEVKTSIEPSRILIGEHVRLSFSIEVAADARVDFPVFNEALDDKIEIVNYGRTDSLSGQTPGTRRLERILTVTSWEEGFHPVIPFEFVIIQNGDTTVVESEPVLLEVQGVDLDETANLKDIKGIIRIPISFMEILPWLLIMIVFVLTIVFLVRYFRSREKQPVKESIWEKPDIPAHVAAFNSLEMLKSKKLWQQGHIKLYYSELTDILRHYVDKRYDVHSMEMTTEETMQALKPHLENDEIYQSFNAMLELADLVKFAKHIPRDAENDSCMENAFEFVRDTMKKEASLEQKVEKKEQ